MAPAAQSLARAWSSTLVGAMARATVVLSILWGSPGPSCAASAGPGSAPPLLEPPSTRAGYVALLLVNETPFPGERHWVGEQDTRAAMHAILCVLDSRLRHIPPGYQQSHIAAVRTTDVIDIITAGGEKGQCDGFYRDAAGRPTAVPRVHERVAYLVGIAGKGAPGRFARLLEYAQGLATAYVESGMAGADRYAGLERIGAIQVTGRAYSWMTDRDFYAPGGNFVRIPDGDQGSLGGNRFFTLRRDP
ncbi:MAG: hypothetical protein KDA22_12665 [Phycisphaerales bacterium]|nr:hypothetical protein [Phycisphaerales bacterium]